MKDRVKERRALAEAFYVLDIRYDNSDACRHTGTQ